MTSERKARGAVERTYALGERGATVFDSQTISKSPVGALRGMLRNFVTTLFADVSAFVESPKFPTTGAQMLGAMFACDLTDEDYREAAAGIQRAIVTAKKRSAGATNVKCRIFYAIALPEVPTP